MRTRHVVAAGLISLFASPWSILAQGGCPPDSVADVLKDPRVQEALDNAWRDSHEGQPDEHEEGGWIYQCQMPNGDGTFRYYTDVRPWPPGDIDGVGPTHPPRADEYCRLVASYHTHPGGGSRDNSETDEFENWEPSPEDIATSAEDGLPGIIRYGRGDHTHDFTYGYNGMTEPRDPTWSCPGSDASFGWGFGDPHVKTLDGYTYDFQAIGDFVYLTTTRGDLEIQVRQQPYKSLRHASVNTALVVRDGRDRVEWAIDRPDPLLNGVPRPIAAGATVRLQSRAILRRTADGFLFLSSVGDRLTVAVSGEMVDFYLRPAAHRRGQVRGLLGNFDGDPDNDLQAVDGKIVIPTFDGTMDARHPLYAAFGTSWRVPANSSLMSRAFSSALDPRAFPEREPDTGAEALAAAKARCGEKGVTDVAVRDDCAFDLVATGNDTFAVSAGRASKRAEEAERDAGGVIQTDTEVTGDLDNLAARARYSVKLTPGVYLFDARGSERTTWTLTAPDGAEPFDANQHRYMGNYPARLTIPKAGTYAITVGVRPEMLDGSFRFRIRTVAPAQPKTLALDAEATGRIAAVGEEHAYTLDLRAGTYEFQALAADNTAWTLTMPGGETPFDANQQEYMETVASVAIAKAGRCTLTVRGRGMFGLGDYRIKVSAK